MEQTVKCPICGRPYKVYDMYMGDQSACPTCREEAKKNMIPSIKWEYHRKPTDKPPMFMDDNSTTAGKELW